MNGRVLLGEFHSRAMKVYYSVISPARVLFASAAAVPVCYRKLASEPGGFKRNRVGRNVWEL